MQDAVADATQENEGTQRDLQVVPPAGFEPAAKTLEGSCSIP
jgi:hypothetical protein